MSRRTTRSRAFQGQRPEIGLSGRLWVEAAIVALVVGLATAAGCGKKGLPVPPAHTVAAPAPKAKAPPAIEPTSGKERRQMQPLLPP